VRFNVEMEGITMRINVIETGGDWVLLCNSPFGRCSTTVSQPFSEAGLVSALHDMEKANLKSTAKVLLRDSTSPEVTARAFGGRLIDVLFSGENRILFDRCRESARRHGKPMRLLVETNGPNASRIPWEFATDPVTRDDYLALRVPMARALSVAEPIPPLSVEPPLRVLGVLARPRDLPELDYLHEKERISAAFDRTSSDLVEVHWLPGDSWREIDDALREGTWHVLHFVGHGGFSDELGAGYLELSDDDGNAKRISSVDMGRAISRSRGLRLVVLNACDSASVGASDVFASTAAKLMREGIPAVVAMQYEITDLAALAFSAAFYEAIARSVPVDEAVTFAREQVRVNLGSLEWATPVLFLASDETAIFDVRAAPQARPRERPEEPRPSQRPGEVVPGPQPHVPQRSAVGGEVPSGDPVPSDWTTGVSSTLRSWFAGAKPDAASKPPRLRADPPSATADPPPQTAAVPTPPASVTSTEALRTVLSMGPADLVAVATQGGNIRMWSLDQHRWTARCSLPGGVTARLLVWHPRGRYFATANTDGTVTVWDMHTETHVRLLSPECGAVQGLAFSHDGRWLVLSGADRTVQVFDVYGRRVRHVRVEPPAGLAKGWVTADRLLGAVAFTSDDRGIIVAANDGRVCLLDVRGAVVSYWPHDAEVKALAVADGRLATSGSDGRLRVWDSARALLWRQDVEVAHHLSWSDDGRLAVASRTGALSVWSIDGQELARTAIDGPPVGVGFWNGAVITGAADGQIQVWRVSQERESE
jgi:hypothetical protein